MLIALSIAAHVLGFGLCFARYLASDEVCDLLSLAAGAVYALVLLAVPHGIGAIAGPAAGWLSLVVVAPAAIGAPALRGRASSLVLRNRCTDPIGPAMVRQALRAHHHITRRVRHRIACV